MRLSFHHKVLIAVAAVLTAILTVEIPFGVSEAPPVPVTSDDVSRPPASVEEPAAYRLPPRGSLRSFVEHPLFERSREQVRIAVPTPERPAETANVRLLGIVMNATESIAVLRAEGSAGPVRARIGDSVGGWRIAQITENSVLLRDGDSVQRVSLPYGE